MCHCLCEDRLAAVTSYLNAVRRISAYVCIETGCLLHHDTYLMCVLVYGERLAVKTAFLDNWLMTYLHVLMETSWQLLQYN